MLVYIWYILVHNVNDTWIVKPPKLSGGLVLKLSLFSTALGAGIGLVAPWANVLEALAMKPLSWNATTVL